MWGEVGSTLGQGSSRGVVGLRSLCHVGVKRRVWGERHFERSHKGGERPYGELGSDQEHMAELPPRQQPAAVCFNGDEKKGELV